MIRVATRRRAAALVPFRFAIAVVLLCGLFSGARPTSAQESTDPFVQGVDLRTLGEIAVNSEGRLKSLGSHANAMMQFVSGPRKIDGQEPLFTYFDLLFRPDAYADADIIYVKNKLVRDRIAVVLENTPRIAAEPGMSSRIEAFRKRGLISKRLLSEPELGPLLREIESDLIRTAKQADALKSAIAVMRPEFLLDRLRIVPPGLDEPEIRWHGIAELQMVPGEDDAFVLRAMATEPLVGIDAGIQSQIADAWRAMVNGWVRGDADAVNASTASLATLLPQVNEALYPDRDRLAWESWYFRWDQLTSVWLIYLLAIALLLCGFVYRWPWARWSGLGVFAIAAGLHTFAFVLRWYISGRFPNSNMFEAVTTTAWMCAAAALVMEVFVRKTPMRTLFALGAAGAGMVALMTAHFLPVALNPNISNMMPVLHDVWLYIHTNVIIFSYGLIFMAAVTAFFYLVRRVFGGTASFARVGGAGSLVLAGPGGRPSLADDRSDAGEILDGVTMILMELSFVLLWAGIVMGAIWADHSWGRPWGWDPKEVFALNTFIIFAILIHVRLKAKDKGLWTAILAVIGAGVMLFNWIIINFVISGLHSYA